jgi:hypothetical protein
MAIRKGEAEKSRKYFAQLTERLKDEASFDS